MKLVYHSSSLAKMAVVAEVFDIDQHTGFMAPVPPPDRLPQYWEDWEILLDTAVKSNLQVSDKLGLSEEERAISKRWRETVRAVRTTLQMDITSPSPNLTGNSGP
jgi:Indoleamine 2,3-dioxygenase